MCLKINRPAVERVDKRQPPHYPSRMPSKSAKNSAPVTNQVAEFEESLDELEKLVTRMEESEMGLDDSLQSFERGIALYRSCQGALEQAELRVKQLTDPGRPETAEPFNPETP